MRSETLNSSKALDTAADGFGYSISFIAAIITGSFFCCCGTVCSILWCSIKDLVPRTHLPYSDIEMNNNHSMGTHQPQGAFERNNMEASSS